MVIYVKKKKILYIVNTMNIGGIENLIMSILHNIDRKKFQIDFMLLDHNKSYYEDEIIKLNSKIYKLKFNRNIFRNLIEFIKFLKKYKFDVVHVHLHFYSAFFILGAYISGVKIKISHMHSFSDNAGNSLFRRIYRLLCRFIMRNLSDYCCACSEEAAIYGYGYNCKKNVIINNCIDVSSFTNIDIDLIKKMKEELNITNHLILGSVARFSEEKNQKFIIDILKKMIYDENVKNIKCLFIGDGPLKDDIVSYATQNNVIDNCIFLGSKIDVNNYLYLFDIFLFPSLYEGFGIVLLEAQALGIFSIASTNVPRITDMDLNLVKYIDLSNINDWISIIKNYGKSSVNYENIKKQIIKKGFDISNTINMLSFLYEK